MNKKVIRNISALICIVLIALVHCGCAPTDPWDRFCNYLKDNNVVSAKTFKDSLNTTTTMTTTKGVISLDKDTIRVTSHTIISVNSEGWVIDNTFAVTIKKYSDICTFTLSVINTIDGKVLSTNGNGEFSKSKFDIGNSFGHYSSFESDTASYDNDLSRRILECMSFLADSVYNSGLELEMKDLGFENYLGNSF